MKQLDNLCLALFTIMLCLTLFGCYDTKQSQKLHVKYIDGEQFKCIDHQEYIYHCGGAYQASTYTPIPNKKCDY